MCSTELKPIMSSTTPTNSPLDLVSLGIGLVDAGLVTIPTFDFQKYPMGWKESTLDTAWKQWDSVDPDLVTGAWSRSSTWPSDLVCADVDVYNEASLERALNHLGLAHAGIHVSTASGGRHVYFRWPDRPSLPTKVPLPTGGHLEFYCSDRDGGVMIPLSRADTDKKGPLTRGDYSCESIEVFIDPDAWPEPDTEALKRLAESYGTPERVRRRKGKGGAEHPEDRLCDALLGVLQIQLFPHFSKHQFKAGNRMPYFLSCGHIIGMNAAVDGSDLDLARLLFEDVADRGFVDWSDDASGVKHGEALVHFADGISMGRSYAEPGKEYMLERRLKTLGVEGKEAATGADELTAAFRRVFDGAVHLRVRKSGTENIGYEMFLLRGAPGLHLDPDEINTPSVEVVQLPRVGSPRDYFQEVIRQLGLAGRAAQDFVSVKAGYPRMVWDFLYQRGTTLQTQVDWTQEIRSAADRAKTSPHFGMYGETCAELNASEKSRLWYSAAPRKQSKPDAQARIDRDTPYISGLSLDQMDDYHFIASEEWWDKFVADNSGADGITKWINKQTVTRDRRGYHVRAVPLSTLFPSEEDAS